MKEEQRQTGRQWKRQKGRWGTRDKQETGRDQVEDRETEVDSRQRMQGDGQKTGDRQEANR